MCKKLSSSKNQNTGNRARKCRDTRTENNEALDREKMVKTKPQTEEDEGNL